MPELQKDEKKDLVVEFSKPYKFEGTEYNKVDFSGLEDLTTSDIIAADKEFANSGQFAMMNETSTGYACILAAKGSKLPSEFFLNLPAKEGLKVKRQVMAFLNK